MRTLARWTLALALVVITPASAAMADEHPAWCTDEPELTDTHQTLRAWALHAVGRLPTALEIDAVVDGELEAEALLEDWLASPEFGVQVARRLRALLWHRVNNHSLLSGTTHLRRNGGDTPYWRTGRGNLYRGKTIACLDQPATWTDGVLDVIVTTENGVTYQREGYVERVPYWAPELVMKVCAFDAQEALVGVSGAPCSYGLSLEDSTCGCGPDLRWCRATYGGESSHQVVSDSLGYDVDRRIQAVIAKDEPYTALFTSQRAFVNGPIVHYLRYQTGMFGQIDLLPHPFVPEGLPDLQFTDVDTWEEVTLSSYHAGVLTAPGYLFRHMTNRARSSRFRDAFLCDPFVAPAGGIPLDSGAPPHPDLQQREGCKYCHTILEPISAYWGRWATSGGGYLDPEGFPPLREDCLSCALENTGCGNECKRFYHTESLGPLDVAYLGMLRAFVFRKEGDVPNIDGGPKLWVSRALADGSLAECTAQRTFEWLMGREAQALDQAWLEELSQTFVASGYRYRDLVREVLTSDHYRRVR
jgi:hypothetical protein